MAVKARRSLVLIVTAALAAVVAVVAIVLASSSGGDDARGFRVSGNHLLAPNGHRFIVRGVVMPFGTFAGGDGGGLARVNEERVASDARQARRDGANLARVMVVPRAVSGPGFRRLEHVVAALRRANLVVEVGATYATFSDALPLVRRMAKRWKDDPYVWIQPMNEPYCTNQADIQSGRCRNWDLWRREHTRYLRAIRRAGNKAPVVVNTPGYSFDLRPLARYRLADRNVIYGVHRYGNQHPTFDATERATVDQVIGAPSRRFPVVLDEFGNYNGPGFPNQVAWAAGMANWAAAWIAHGDGIGATAFNWRWSDGNTLVGPNGRLTPWGQAFAHAILRRR